MKWLGILVMTVLLAGVPGLAGAQQAGGPATTPPAQAKSSSEASQQAQPAKSYSPEERQAYEKKTAEALKIMEQKLGDLRGKQGKVRPQLKRQVLRAMANLDRGFYGAKSQFAAMQKASEQDWPRYKAALDGTMARWEADYANVAARLQ
jgi:hypothetical protein